LLNNPQKTEQMRSAARKRATSYGWETIGQQVLHLYDELLVTHELVRAS
jgi:glycosyltransferase involved in cell wall biosynthesis